MVSHVRDECYCSGVSSQCRQSDSHYWSTLRLAAGQGEPVFTVTDREGNPVNNVNPVYDSVTEELTYQHSGDEEQANVQYWKLPHQFLGVTWNEYKQAEFS